MPRRKRNRKFIQMQVSEEAHGYIRLRKHASSEPLSDVLDRLLGEYRLRGTAELSEAKDNLAKVNDIYLDRIHELEAKGKTLEEFPNE